jgi:hypothetical protein
MSYDKEGELSDALLRAFMGATRSHIVIDGIVESVDETKFTCSVKVGDTINPATYYNVPLRVLISKQASIVEIPKEGTEVIICFRGGNLARPQILAIHEALKILVNCDSILFNDGTLGGLVKVDDLLTKLNTIEKDINMLKNVFSVWSPVPNDGGTALKAAAGTWFGQQLTPTIKQDIENPKIKQ